MDVTSGISKTRSSDILTHLDKILSSPQFRQSERLKRFLKFVIDHSLEGDSDRLKESVIGVEVFDRQPGYDPKTDAIVRVEAHRLRQKLRQYYESEGSSAGIRFSVPKGQYGVQVEFPPAPPVEPQALAVSATGVPEPIRWRQVGAAGFLVAAVAVTVWFFTSSRDRTAPIQLERLTSYSGWSTDPVMSPDGKFVVFSSDLGAEGPLSLWRIPSNGGTPVRLTPGAYDAIEPDISPNANAVVFRSRHPQAPGIYVLRLDANEQATLLVQNGLRPRYSPDGAWVLYTVANEQEWGPSKLFAIPSAGGGGLSREVVTGFDDAHYGIWSPDSKKILFCGTKRSNSPGEEHDWWIVDFPTGAPPVKTQVFPEYLRAFGGRIPPNSWMEQPGDWVGDTVYVSTILGAVPVLARQELSNRLAWKRPIELLTRGPSMDTRPRVRGDRMVFGSGSFNMDLWSLPLDARTPRRPVRVTNHPGLESFPAAAPGGKYLAYVSDRQGRRQLYLREMATHAERAVHPSTYSQDHLVFSPDGKWVAFREIRDPQVPILLAPVPEGPVKVVHPDAGGPTSWSPDGRYLIYEPGATIAFIGRLELATGKNEVFLSHPDYSLRGGAYSPDGRWIAFYAEEGRTTRRLYIARADVRTLPQHWIQVDRENRMSYNPVWAPDGSTLYYLSEIDGHRCIYQLSLDPVTKKSLGSAIPFYHSHSARQSLLRLTRARLSAIGPVLVGDQLIVAMDEQLADIYSAKLP